jgi:RNA recognition motif-containing protein
MSKKLFVRNIDWNATDDALNELFSQYGNVEEAIIIKDRETGRSKGFGFVTMENDGDADTAMENLDDYDFSGRNIFVSEARPREEG